MYIVADECSVPRLLAYLIISSLSVQARPAKHLPAGLPPAQPHVAVPGQPHSSGARLPLPGLQLRLQPLRPHGPGAVPLRTITITLRWLPQLQLLPQHSGARSNRSIPDPAGCDPPSSGCTHHYVCGASGLPSLPSAPAGPHAVSSSQWCRSCRADGSKQPDCRPVTSSG